MQALIQELLALPKLDKNSIERVKVKWAEKNGGQIPLGSDILKELAGLHDIRAEKLRQALVTKPTRTMSGVSTIAVMTKPAGCVGRCTYCPTSAIAPKSYTGYEPSTMRAIRNNYDPYKIVQNRLAQLHSVGHNTDKNEVIVQGGTFTWMPWDYQYNFVKDIFDAFNQFQQPFLSQKKRLLGIQKKGEGFASLKPSKTLEEAQKINETAKNRVVSLIIETRPDWCHQKEIQELLSLGATRVELGLQSIYDFVLEKIKRGHDLAEAKRAIRELKDAGFKVDLHMMLGLPGSSKELDKEMFRIIFEDEDLRPDGLKIYPCGVIKGSELYEQWKRGEYEPINDDYIAEVLAEIKTKHIPPYVRIKRIMRDIPSNYVEAGYKSTNLRQMVQGHLKSRGVKCRCIRCREVGHRYNEFEVLPSEIKLQRLEYAASGGREIFLSFEDVERDILLGFLRLRLCKNGIAFVRELHVYGEAIAIGESADSNPLAAQHKGLGKKLLAEAESVAKKNNCEILKVLSGVGVKEYYKKFKYADDGFYVSKAL
ncbi:MAG: tRNA uridine(34) 5-carboxymethylaminomethyl modification radical SAM/GNAT enzyme Elp3 [DPANN group archaeon]|nr:tRNA uridine(34) 5-carboxymethylaminomethyl modification radical SAM/GNAT enzyme Elp3 [DPANN group archaeon]